MDSSVQKKPTKNNNTQDNYYRSGGEVVSPEVYLV